MYGYVDYKLTLVFMLLESGRYGIIICAWLLSAVLSPFPRWESLGCQLGKDWLRLWRTRWGAITVLWQRKQQENTLVSNHIHQSGTKCVKEHKLYVFGSQLYSVVDQFALYSHPENKAYFIENFCVVHYAQILVAIWFCSQIANAYNFFLHHSYHPLCYKHGHS